MKKPQSKPIWEHCRAIGGKLYWDTMDESRYNSPHEYVDGFITSNWMHASFTSSTTGKPR